MTAPLLIQVTPNKSAAIYTAARIINERGPMQRAELFATMDFGPERTREAKLQDAFDSDWLRQTLTGYISLTDYSKRHFELNGPKEEYVGQITPAQYRPNVFATTLSKKYIPNRRGPRADVPAWSVRENVSFQAKA